MTVINRGVGLKKGRKPLNCCILCWITVHKAMAPNHEMFLQVANSPYESSHLLSAPEDLSLSAGFSAVSVFVFAPGFSVEQRNNSKAKKKLKQIEFYKKKNY